jgi:hypothetical protein
MRSSQKTIMFAAGSIVLAVVLIVLGVTQGDAIDTWRKATRICFECIGIG